VTWTAALVALAGLVLAGRVAWRRSRAPRLPPPLDSPPEVAVLLPARDEEDNLGPCVSALLAQTAPVRILVLDDRSTDRTRERAERLAAADARVEVLSVPPPPAGASGKVHALACGLAEIRKSGRPPAGWVLSIDADARPGREAIARALAAAGKERLGAVSLAARQSVGSVGEALVTPLVFALLDARLGDWRAAAAGEGEAVGNGQFFLFESESLERAGGFAAIAGEPLDDVALARRLAAAGARVGFWRAREVLEVRMYRGLAATFQGWRRNLALLRGADRGPRGAVVAACLAPAIVALVSVASGHAAAAWTAWIGGALASVLARSGTGSAPAWGLLYPLDALTLAACWLAAARDRSAGRLASWRGRRLDPPEAGGP
jgi:glycosyltransferase involved in cell wall biosynthesis